MSNLQAALAEKDKELADYKDATNISPAVVEEWCKENVEDKKRIEELEKNNLHLDGLWKVNAERLEKANAKLKLAEAVVEALRNAEREMGEALVKRPSDLLGAWNKAKAALSAHDKEKPDA